MKRLLLAALAPVHFVLAQNPVTVDLEQFATGLDSIVDIVHAGDERLFAVQRSGVIRIVGPDGSVLPTPFLNIRSRVNSTGGEQGLLGLAFDPNYSANGIFYVNYTYGTGAGSTRIARYHVTADPDIADLNSEESLYTWPQPFANHNGGDLAFGSDGYLYGSLGDGGSANDPLGNAQDITDPLGDLIRLDVSDSDTTYMIPPTNPFVTAGGDTLPEIWASGLRNPWRFSFDAITGDIWIGDVGQNTYEEVDFWPAGDNMHPNFGWRCYEGLHAFNTSGCQPQSAYVAPVAEHAQTTQGWCAVTGGVVYRGQQFPRLEGRYLYTDYCGGQFYSLLPDGSGGWLQEEVRSQTMLGLACIGENSALELFAGNTETGVIYRIVDACPMDAPTVELVGNTLTSTPASGYQWYFNGQAIVGATAQSYTFDEDGSYYVVADLGAGCMLASEAVDYIVSGINTMHLAGVEVFPVPATDHLVVVGLSESLASMELVDMTGRVVLSRSVAAHTGRIVISLSEVAVGQYALLFRGAEGRAMGQRIVSVQR